MEFNLTTFILEIINFLVLLWILQRLFYKPLLTMIDRRKRHIEASLADAKKLHEDAENLRNQYENRQKLWEQDKQSALSAFHQQVETERSKQMEKLRIELEQERQKALVTLTRQQQEFQLQTEKEALLNGARFAGLLLKQASGPDLEKRLFSMLIDHFTVLPEDFRMCLQSLEHKKSAVIKVTSAYPISTGDRLQLEHQLNALLNNTVVFQYYQDADLVAGVRIDIGAWVLHANLKHELAGFAELAYESE